VSASISPSELAALGCAFIWALNGLLLRTQSEKVPPATMNAVRCAVAAVLFWLLLPFEETPGDLFRVPLVEWGLLFASVIIGIGIGDTLYLAALKEIGISRTIALSGTFPLTTMLWETLLLHHPPNPALVAGGLLVAAGILLLSRQSHPLNAIEEARVRLKLGVILSLIASLFWGLSSVLLKPAIAHLTLIQANAIRMPMVAVFLYFTRILPGSGETLRAFDSRSFSIVALTGVLGMGAGAYLFLYAIEHTEVTRAVTLTSSAPLFGMIMGVLFLKERLSIRLVLGMVCCMAGVWVVV
jgi:DME family drug/metabolite transporter